MEDTLSPAQLLQFYLDAGVDEYISDEAYDRFTVTETTSGLLTAAPLSMPAAAPAAASAGTFESLGEARERAKNAKNLDELREALDSFKGIALRRTATQMVFSDGVPTSKIMLVGEAPGADEDRLGRPFVGVSGQLLDRMFDAIGMSRQENIYITNVINWRPPGNRAPSDSEVSLSLPFIERHIELVNPSILVFVGGVAAKALLHTTAGITRLRGKWTEYKTDGMQSAIPVMPLFHPAYLLRSPAQKSLAWADLQTIRDKARECGIA